MRNGIMTIVVVLIWIFLAGEVVSSEKESSGTKSLVILVSGAKISGWNSSMQVLHKELHDTYASKADIKIRGHKNLKGSWKTDKRHYGTYERIILIGHSLGGDAAYGLVSTLVADPIIKDKKISIILVTIDATSMWRPKRYKHVPDPHMWFNVYAINNEWTYTPIRWGHEQKAYRNVPVYGLRHTNSPGLFRWVCGRILAFVVN